MKVRALIIAVLGSVMLTDSAFALSCMRPDLARTMENAKSSDKFYYVLVGQFRGHSYHQPPSNNVNDPKPIRTTMWFDGRSIAQHPWHDSHLNGFPVEIQTSCAGPWCGSPPRTGETQIAFVEARPGQAPLLRIGACPEWLYSAQPNDGQVRSLRDCMDKPCKQALRPDYH